MCKNFYTRFSICFNIFSCQLLFSSPPGKLINNIQHDEDMKRIRWNIYIKIALRMEISHVVMIKKYITFELIIFLWCLKNVWKDLLRVSVEKISGTENRWQQTCKSVSYFKLRITFSYGGFLDLCFAPKNT